MGIGGLCLLYFGSLYYLNRELFWRQFIFGIVMIAVGTAAVVWWFDFRAKQKQKRVAQLLEQIRANQLEPYIKNFIDMFGAPLRRSSSPGWSFRNRQFEWDRIDDLEGYLLKSGVQLQTAEGKREIFDLLKHYVQEKEEHITIESMHATIRTFSKLSGTDFEVLLVRLYTAMGYTVQRIGGVGDQGGDLIANKNGVRLLIQAKCYQKKSVGNDAVQQAVTAKQVYWCNQAAVITTSYFTNEALAAAQATAVELIPRAKLQEMLVADLRERWD